MTAIEQRAVGPGCDPLSEPREKVEVTALVAKGLGLAHHRLADQIEAITDVAAAQRQRALQSLFGATAPEKSARESAQRFADGTRYETGGDPGLHVAHAEGDERGERETPLAEVLVEMAGQLAVIVQSRQDIDEAQGLHPEALVLHDPLQQPLEPSIHRPRALGLAAHRRQ